MSHSGRGLEAAIQHSAAPRAVLSFSTPPLALYAVLRNHVYNICTVSLGITCTPDLLESVCPPRGVSCPSTHHIHRQSMSIPKNVSVSQYGGNVNNTIRTILEQKPTLCVCLSGLEAYIVHTVRVKKNWTEVTVLVKLVTVM